MRKLTEQELTLVQKAIIRKEIAVLELLAEVYDHYISHLEQYSELEFSGEFKNLEEKWTYAYCDKLQQEFRKGVNQSIRSLQWKLIKSYFTWPRFAVTILVVASLISLTNLIDPKTYLLIVILPVLIILIVFNFYILFNARKKFKSLRSIFNRKSMGIWVVSEEANNFGLLAVLPLSFFSLLVQLPRMLEISDSYSNPYYLLLIAVFSFFLALHALTCYEAWKIKSKTALI